MARGDGINTLSVGVFAWAETEPKHGGRNAIARQISIKWLRSADPESLKGTMKEY